MVLEFGAGPGLEEAWRLLNEHRPGVEMLRIALQENGSPWADVLQAMSATLPSLTGGTDDVLAAVRRLIETGLPGEEVGLEAYTLDPQLELQDRYDRDPARSGARS